MGQNSQDELFDSLISELRRGMMVISVLSQLKAPQYGYSLVELLEEKGMPIDASTLYPLLRRLESQGLLESSWDISAKPRKYYQQSEYGKQIYEKLCAYWGSTSQNINSLMKG